jgi:glyoxylase-like metal-dependent hydrolase (beta-lactamase superfamily II)
MTGAGNWTYLVGEAAPILIDAGVGRAEHLHALATAAPGGPRQVIVTHAHVDHASGASAIAERWPGAPMLKFPWPERDAKYPVSWRPLAGGDVLDMGDGALEIVHTPGHAPDHVALWDAASRSLFSGDLVVLGSTVVIPASGGGDLLDYLASLRKVLALAPTRLLPAHGPGIDDPAAVIHQYLEHRQMREDQVLTALDEGRDTIGTMVERIYRGLAPPLVPMARDSVLAHLRKLEREGRVTRMMGTEDSQWTRSSTSSTSTAIGTSKS